jgi:DNA-binding LacI/PurR family transcriptional regulator
VLALGALRAVRDMGLRVPEDISLLGHDDIVLVELSDPALTTIRIDTARIGQLAAQILLDARALAEGGHEVPPSRETPRVVTIGTELIVRASTGPVTRAVTLSHSSTVSARVPIQPAPI